ncbi:MAG: hypothetical protein JSS75_00920 [Bacteroidetes bacterium]|nr:hypothetical protein [Bacteroidota bacterium]
MHLLRDRSNAPTNAGDARSAQKLSRERLAQVKGEILQVLYKQLVPTGGVDIIVFLARKGLYQHLTREMRRQESAVCRSTQREIVAQFYKDTVTQLAFILYPWSIPDALASEVRRYISEYVLIAESDYGFAQLVVLARIHQELEHTLKGSTTLDTVNRMIEELERLMQSESGAENSLVRFGVGFMLLRICAEIACSHERTIRYCEYALKVTEDLAASLGEQAPVFRLICRMNHPEQRNNFALEVKDFLNSPSFDPSISSMRYLEQFLPFLLHAGEHEFVEQYLARPEKREVDTIHHSLVRVICMIYRDEHDAAGAMLQDLLNRNRGDRRTLVQELHLRCIDSYLHSVRGDHVWAEETLSRHIRYIRQHAGTREECPHLIFTQQLLRLIREAEKGSRERAQQLCSAYVAEHSGPIHYRFMIERTYQRYFEGR